MGVRISKWGQVAARSCGRIFRLVVVFPEPVRETVRLGCCKMSLAIIKINAVPPFCRQWCSMFLFLLIIFVEFQNVVLLSRLYLLWPVCLLIHLHPN